MAKRQTNRCPGPYPIWAGKNGIGSAQRSDRHSFEKSGSQQRLTNLRRNHLSLS